MFINIANKLKRSKMIKWILVQHRFIDDNDEWYEMNDKWRDMALSVINKKHYYVLT